MYWSLNLLKLTSFMQHANLNQVIHRQSMQVEMLTEKHKQVRRVQMFICRSQVNRKVNNIPMAGSPSIILPEHLRRTTYVKLMRQLSSMWYFISRKLKPCSTNEYKNYNQKATTIRRTTEAFSPQRCPRLTHNIHIPETFITPRL